jgi:hypothetical protein
VERAHSYDRVGAQLCSVESRVVEGELRGVRRRALSVRYCEVGAKIIQGTPRARVHLVPEALANDSSGGFRPSGVVVEQHERDVVPVFLLAPAVGRGDLGEQEAGKPGDVHVDLVAHAADARPSPVRHVILGGEPGCGAGFTAPSASHESKLTIAPPGCESRSASSSNLTSESLLARVQKPRSAGLFCTRNRTCVRYNMYMREEDVMRATDIGMVHLGYGRFVRADDIVAVLPIEEGRGRGRRTHVHVAGLAGPIVASRSEGAILADMKAASDAGRRGAGTDERRSPRAEQDVSVAPHRRSRLGFGARRA